MTTRNKMLYVRLPEQLHAQLAELTLINGRSERYLAVDALGTYMSHLSWQVAELQAGLAEVDLGEFATDEQMGTMFGKR